MAMANIGIVCFCEKFPRKKLAQDRITCKKPHELKICGNFEINFKNNIFV